jgi:hypothetical protein
MNNKKLIDQLQDYGVSGPGVPACNLAAERLAFLDRAESVINWFLLDMTAMDVGHWQTCDLARELLKEME